MAIKDFTADPFNILPHDTSSAMDESFDFTGTQTPSIGASSQGNMLAAGMFTSMFATIGSSIANGIALSSQAAYKKQQSEYNAKMSELQAQSALQSGDQEADRIRRAASNAVSEVRTNAAASGVDVNSGSAMDVQNSVKQVSSIDVLTTQNNAARKAYGFQVQANADTTEGDIAQNTAKAEEVSTAVTGGETALGRAAEGFYYGSGGTIRSEKGNK